MNPSLQPHGPRLGRLLFPLLLPALFAIVWSAAAKPEKAEMRELKREMGADSFGGKPRKPDDKPAAKAGRSNLGEAESRSLEKLREHLEVTDDAEWEIIAARIITVGELRKSLWTGSPALRGPSPGEKDKRSTRPGTSTQSEQDLIRSALRDKLPDAEIKARLARAHETYQQNQAKLARAQAELRAVLTVRQEAVAVMAGLLPP